MQFPVNMKNLLVALLCISLGAACTQEANYKTERDEVMKFHDVVMADNGLLVNNGMKLDTLLRNLPALKAKFPAMDTLQQKEEMQAVLERLNKAEELMNDWMHAFEPDITGKSNEEAIKYFKAERVKIGRIDSLYKTEIKASTMFLKKLGK